MLKLDCLGDICPVPIIKLKSEQTRIEGGATVMLVTDHSCTVESIRNFCCKHGYQLSEEEPINGVWELTIWREK